MNRLIEKMVFSGLVMAWRLATWPTRTSPSLVKATTEGVRRLPSWLGMTTGLPPSSAATTEFVVPRSMPITLPMAYPSCAGPEPAVRPSRFSWGGASCPNRDVARAGAFGRLRDGDGQHAAFDARLRPVEGKPRRQWHGPDEAAVPALEETVVLPRILPLLALLTADNQTFGRDAEVEIITLESGDFDGHDQLVVGLGHVRRWHPRGSAERAGVRGPVHESLQPAVEVIAEREALGQRRRGLPTLASPRQEC